MLSRLPGSLRVPPVTLRRPLPRRGALPVRALLHPARARAQVGSTEGPSCPLPNQPPPRPNVRALSVEWYKRRIADAADEGNLQGIHDALQSLLHLDLSERCLAVDYLDRDGITWMMRAARAGHLESVQALHKEGASLDQVDKAGLNAADWALLAGHETILAWLRDAGVTPRRADKVGLWTLAYLAVVHGHAALLQHVLGRDLGHPYVVDTLDSPLTAAPFCTHVLSDARGRFTPLTCVAQVCPNERAVEVVLQHMDATQATLEGDPAVVLAAYHREDPSEAMHQMLHRGADVRARSREGWTLAHLICAYSNNPVAGLRVLMDHCADMDALTPEGWTPLHFLQEHGDFPEATAMLLQAGCDPRQETFRSAAGVAGSSAVELAARYGRLESLACMGGAPAQLAE